MPSRHANNLDPQRQPEPGGHLQFVDQPGEVEQAATVLDVDDQVQVALAVLLAPGDGTEHRHVGGAVAGADIKDLGSAGPQGGERPGGLARRRAVDERPHRARRADGVRAVASGNSRPDTPGSTFACGRIPGSDSFVSTTVPTASGYPRRVWRLREGGWGEAARRVFADQLVCSTRARSTLGSGGADDHRGGCRAGGRRGPGSAAGGGVYVEDYFVTNLLATVVDPDAHQRSGQGAGALHGA